MRWLALAGVFVLAGCGEERAGGARGAPFTSAEHRFTAVIPARWHVAAESLTPTLVNPVEVLSAGTMPAMRPARGGCAHVPVGALEAMGPRDAFVTVQERAGAPEFPHRPAAFALDAPDRVEAEDCARNGASLELHWFGFRDARRGFHVLVALGRKAPVARRAEALALLDSLRFAPGAAGVDLDPDRAVPFRDADASLSWVMPLPPWRHYDWPQTSARGERLALGTFPLERSPPDGNCTPRAALDALPPDGAFVYVFESVDGGGAAFPPRTGELALGPLRTYECLGTSRMARWREGGRGFQAHVVVGPRASAAVEREARSILNSIRVL